MSNFNKLAEKFEYWCDQPLEVIAKAVKKTKEKKKHDPKAKVRNRGKCVFPANSSKVNDDKDHYPLPDEAHGRSALSYAGKQKSAPWYNGTVEEMRSAVQRAVHKAFPGIGKEDKKKTKKSSLEILIEKYADEDTFVKCPVCKDDRLASSPAHAKVHARQCAKKHNVDMSKYKSFIDDAEEKSKKHKKSTDETSSITKNANPQAFSAIVSQYEGSADCVK